MTASPPVLIVPGLNNSGPTHWQSHWFKRIDGAVWVDQTDWELPTLGDWVASLVQAIRDNPGAILVGHSLGCALIAHVAQLRGNRGIGGALLVAPADVNRNGPAGKLLHGFSPMPQQRLNFPSIVVASETDPYVHIDRAEEFSRSWGSRFINLGPSGHINVASGHGPWNQGLLLLQELREELGADRPHFATPLQQAEA
jgi:predicted alpha/beta hydrolase family esterase